MFIKRVLILLSILMLFTGCQVKKQEETYTSMRSDKVVKTAFDKTDDEEQEMTEEEPKEESEEKPEEKPEEEDEAEEEVPLKRFSKVTADALNLRVTADDDANIIRQLYTDEIVEVLNVTGKWAAVRYGEILGYVTAEYLDEMEIKWVDKEDAELRYTASPYSDIILTFEKDAEVIMLGDTLRVDGQTWEHVRFGDYEGYVLRSDLR